MTNKYSDFMRDFSVDSILDRFVGDYQRGINVCEEICDRYAADPARVALR